MATGVGKHKVLALGPTEPWSVREKLCLASSVMRSGDQNWVSVSRAIKPFSEPGRPPDWFSQKHCASQYSELLETTEAPKRKRGEKGEVVETVEDVIVRRLTAERIEELKKLLRDTQEKYRRLKKEAELIQAGHLDSKLEELWGEIVQKKKQDEEEAELKRKATDAAYQHRQAMKNTPKRVTSVTVRSPLGASSPGLESSLPDTPQPTPDDPCTAPTPAGPAVFIPLAEPSGPTATEASLGTLLEDSPQKKLLTQKATPPASPLLSELLKKGSLLAASPRLVGEGDVPAGLANGGHGADLQITGPALPAGHATTGAPTLSRLLEASPAQFPTPLGSLAAPDPPNAPPTPAGPPASDSPASHNTGEDPGGNAAAQSSPAPDEGKGAELGEEDLVAVSYMGDELDLATVGDIIAIIEEKVDDSAEALDAAAVEAALSLCEDAVAGHTLSGPWEAAEPSVPAPDPLDPSPNTIDPTPSTLDPSSAHVNVEMKEAAEEEGDGDGGRVEGVAEPGPAPSSPATPGDPQVEAAGVQPQSQSGSDREEGGREGGTPSPSVKCESEEWTQQGMDMPCADSEDSSASGKDSREVKEEDGGSEADEGSMSEPKECGEGEGEGAYLSELEPPASESEDGFSLPASSLQRYTTADSAPSSPASSQFSMSSEDQEAIQAQKIWKKAIMLVWRAAANHRYASVFLQPVSDDIAPGYHSIVHRPMDLSVIKKNIETGLIRTTAEFQRDIMLMFQNAVMYNSSDHDVYHMALEMQRDVLEQIQQFLATQLIMQTSESGISAKSLRGRESTRKDSTDKDGGTRGRRCAIEADLKMKK
ncbi:hypothetical protein MATL_G00173950 [Megalops atlanticus]|uniref:Bromodomain-containing protein 8 n=1 Tax=Megalops atlanticus TaxID=7932 RepID=A0A9D3PRY4_MEGAT|nr:hypothetical protein MATL_G00173950 [Megalops atlanticus]